MSICSCSYSKLSTEEHFRRGINEGQSCRRLLLSHTTPLLIFYLFIKELIQSAPKSPKKTKKEKEVVRKCDRGRKERGVICEIGRARRKEA